MHVCFPGKDTVLQNVPQANGNDPIKGRNPFAVWDTLFSCHLIYKHERLSTPAPGPLVVVKAVFLAGEM